MTLQSAFLFAAAAVGAVALAVPAQAATQVYAFTIDGSSNAQLGPSPYGTVTVTEAVTGGGVKALDFTVAINNDYWRINDGNNNHRAFTFSLANNPQVSVTGFNDPRFSAVSISQSTGVSAPPFWTGSNVQYVGVNYDGGGAGWNRGFVGPLSFRVTSSTYGVTLNSLVSRVYNGQNVYFTTDLVDRQGDTGNVGATLMPGGVPEPSTWALLILGFGVIGAGMRRRQGGLALAAA